MLMARRRNAFAKMGVFIAAVNLSMDNVTTLKLRGPGGANEFCSCRWVLFSLAPDTLRDDDAQPHAARAQAVITASPSSSLAVDGAIGKVGILRARTRGAVEALAEATAQRMPSSRPQPTEPRTQHTSASWRTAPAPVAQWPRTGQRGAAYGECPPASLCRSGATSPPPSRSWQHPCARLLLGGRR